MPNSPLVSVIMPCYNRTDIVANAVQSVQQQTFLDWELVIVDDGSTSDLGSALAPSQGDARIRIVRHPVNRGEPAARNTGIDSARGRFIAFLDSDDLWMPKKLERQVGAVLADRDPENVFCVTRTLVKLGSNRNVVRPLSGPAPGRSFGEFLYNDGGFMQSSSIFLAKSLARRFPFRENLLNMVDHLFFLEVGEAGARFLLVPETLTVWQDDDRADRVSQGDDELKLRRIVDRFLEEAKDVAPPHVLLAAEVRYLSGVLWRTSPVKSLRLLRRARRAQALSTRQVAMLFCRNALRRETYNTLRHWLAALHGKTILRQKANRRRLG